MDSEALVQLALNDLSGTQKELAVKLGVSPTQISKWKKGEHVSLEMEKKLRAIAKIEDKDPSFVLSAGSLEEAIKWERLIHYLAKMAEENAETGYQTCPLHDELGLLCGETFEALKEMGVTLPKEFPKELDVDYKNQDDAYDDEEIWKIIERNPYSSLIYKIYKLLNGLPPIFRTSTKAVIRPPAASTQIDWAPDTRYSILECKRTGL